MIQAFGFIVAALFSLTQGMIELECVADEPASVRGRTFGVAFNDSGVIFHGVGGKGEQAPPGVVDERVVAYKTSDGTTWEIDRKTGRLTLSNEKLGVFSTGTCSLASSKKKF